jgi:hypothetical protein
MTSTAEFVLRAVLIGAGATAVMDLWAMLLRQAGVPSLHLSHLGRWVGHLPRGRWRHPSIASATPVRGEAWIGWCAHYTIGITFAALLVWTCGLDWARAPSMRPALSLGLVTVAAPWFVLQPGMGAGIASWKTPTPVFNAMKSLVTHTVFGLGLYLAAVATAWVLPGR